MNNWKSIVGSASIVTLMGSTAAFADVSAADVWADWQSYLSSFGYEISADENVTSDGVTVDNLVVTIDSPYPDVKINIGSLTFKDMGNGTVSVITPEHMPMNVTSGDEFAATLNYDTTDMSIIVSGDADEMTYDYSAGQIKMSVADLTIEGDKIADPKIEISIDNMAGKSTNTTGDVRQIAQNFTTDLISYDVAVSAPDGEDFTIAIKGSMADFAGASNSAIPKTMDYANMSASLAAGFAGNGKFTWGAGGYEYTASDNHKNNSGKSSSESGELNFAIDQASVSYGGTANGTKASFSNSSMPFPVDITIAQSMFKLLMPINKTETPSDFALTIKLGDFTINDAVWNMVDPGTLLSRDPATVLLDFDGKANSLVDFMDPEALKNSDLDMPVQLHELTLKSLQLKAAGAELTGAGAFTFNNDDLETFSGMPAPTGAVDLKLTGGNGLMDNLVEMGLLPADQAMGARMMMGLFAVAGEGEDTLTSKLEVTGDGHVLANGQRLK